jgi:DNA-binding MarR family transcriptional regulator
VHTSGILRGIASVPVTDPRLRLRLAGPLLAHLDRRLRVEAESELARIRLRPRHVVTLTLLREMGEISQTDLAATLQIDRTNLVGLLNELEDENLIERRRSPEDRRRHTVVLTKGGVRRLAKIEETLMIVEERVLAALGDDERSALYGLLQRATAGSAASCVGEAAEPPAC